MNSFIIPDNLKDFHIHFTGIKGTGMAALVEILFSRGAIISGSDIAETFYTDEILNQLGITPTLFSAENITDKIQLVIHSSAYSVSTNPELIEATNKNIPILLYTQALGQVSSTSFSCGICGVHGKTTTTGLTGSVLRALNLPAQILAGSIINSFGTQKGKGRCTLSIGHKYFVAETCEYQRHFMSFHPKIIVMTSVESDHQDFYPTFDDIQNAFIDYCNLLPQNGILIYCSDDKGAFETAQIVKEKRRDIKLIDYGQTAKSEYRIKFESIDGMPRIRNDCQHFSLAGFSEDFAVVVPGHHLVLNATAAIALAVELLKIENPSVTTSTISPAILTQIKDGLMSFTGAKRRSEIIGKTGSLLFVDDYGHHPTAIKTTIDGYKEFYPDRKIIVDFMSHTYSRTASLLDEFATCFSSADEIVLHKIYPSAREKYSGGVSGKTLFEKVTKNHKAVRYYQEIMDAYDDLSSELSEYKKNNQKILFITMGAGDNWKIGQALFNNLSK